MTMTLCDNNLLDFGNIIFAALHLLIAEICTNSLLICYSKLCILLQLTTRDGKRKLASAVLDNKSNEQFLSYAIIILEVLTCLFHYKVFNQLDIYFQGEFYSFESEIFFRTPDGLLGATNGTAK